MVRTLRINTELIFLSTSWPIGSMATKHCLNIVGAINLRMTLVITDKFTTVSRVAIEQFLAAVRYRFNASKRIRIAYDNTFCSDIICIQ
jgi:hypothetical protein